MHRKVPVRFGPEAAGKRTRTTGTSPAAYRCGSGASRPSRRPPAWSPWPIRGYQGSAHAKIQHRGRNKLAKAIHVLQIRMA